MAKEMTPEQGEVINSLVQDGAVTIARASEISGMSRAWLYGAMERGDLPYIKLGGARRIPRRALMQLLERNLIGA
jgi:excisionase family DNA binding protein